MNDRLSCQAGDETSDRAADSRGIATSVSPFLPSFRPLDFLGQFDRTCPSQTYVQRRGKAGKLCFRIFMVLFDPGFHSGEIPDDAAGCKIEVTGKFAAALYFVNRGVCQRYDQSEFLTAQHPSHAVE